MRTRIMLLMGAAILLIVIVLTLVPTYQDVSVLTFMPVPVLGIVIDKDMRIVHVESESAAERAGIQKGDIIEVLDGASAATQRELIRQVVHETRADQQHTVRVIRAGKRVDVLVVPAPSVPHSQATPTPVLPPYDYL